MSPGTGARYKVSYNRYDIRYSVDEDARLVRVLGIKHQLQFAEAVDEDERSENNNLRPTPWI